MKLSFFIARRYLFSKKSHNAINIISAAAVCGIAVATIAMVCTLSVFNGFQGLVSDMFSLFDPEIKITPAKGKVFDSQSEGILKIKQMPEIVVFSEVLEDNVLLNYHDRQVPATLKGVSANFAELVPINTALIDGHFQLTDEIGNNYATLGLGLATKLGINAGFVYPMEVYAPRRNAKVNMLNPVGSFVQEYLYISGVFLINQPSYDDNLAIAPIELTRILFDYDTEISSLELKFKEGTNIDKSQKKIEQILGDDYIVQNRYQQQEASFQMMNIEKWMTFLILCFILVIAVFNVIGSLSMLIVEKQKDVITLRNMGADNRLISWIFLFEGWLISILGAIIGIVIGLSLCLLQQYFGLLRLGDAGAFVVDAYPVVVKAGDVFSVFITVLIIGFLGALYPVRYLSKKWLQKT
ncbi:MAG: ABC transporter permease [Dysgonamonadaceae bacterium]|jgi:lipoprotein-releasing system permease protein/zinc transport system substrate-binding protein|nr:ABC transporter permease [Dysgonamonadaceae bacterium]